MLILLLLNKFPASCVPWAAAKCKLMSQWIYRYVCICKSIEGVAVLSTTQCVMGNFNDNDAIVIHMLQYVVKCRGRGGLGIPKTL